MHFLGVSHPPVAPVSPALRSETVPEMPALGFSIYHSIYTIPEYYVLLTIETTLANIVCR